MTHLSKPRLTEGVLLYLVGVGDVLARFTKADCRNCFWNRGCRYT